MVAIFVVLLIAVLISVIGASLSQASREANYKSFAARLTNAKIEQRVYNDQLRRGALPTEAYDITIMLMKRAGYEPCIPFTAYATDTSFVRDIESYDSELVKLRREYVKFLHDKCGGPEPTEQEVYNEEDLWGGQTQRHAHYLFLTKAMIAVRQAHLSKGDVFHFKDLGTCLVKDLGYYRLPIMPVLCYSVEVVGMGQNRVVDVTDVRIHPVDVRHASI